MKVVREKIPEYMQAQGYEVDVKKGELTDLIEKLKEECEELEHAVRNNDQDNIEEEIVDIEEVLDGVIDNLSIDPVQLTSIACEKYEQYGGFKNIIQCERKQKSENQNKKEGRTEKIKRLIDELEQTLNEE